MILAMRAIFRSRRYHDIVGWDNRCTDAASPAFRDVTHPRNARVLPFRCIRIENDRDAYYCTPLENSDDAFAKRHELHIP
jgi:hypothetical protein